MRAQRKFLKPSIGLVRRFDCAVVLLHDVVPVLDLTHDGPLASSGIRGVESRYIRAALI